MASLIARTLPRVTVESISAREAIRVLRAYAVGNDTLSANMVISMVDKSKKRGRPRDPIRGMTVLPHVFGTPRKIVVFASGPEEAAAMQAGAIATGQQDLVDKIVKGEIDFDVALATPAGLKEIRTAGKSLRQNMPNVKRGTVVEDLDEAVARFSRGIQFRSSPQGSVNVAFGKVWWQYTARTAASPCVECLLGFWFTCACIYLCACLLFPL
eukprot:m.21772 g.21772  ORF g.21772 m.21772 type:complete len:212 (-) comp8334_c0_seq1:2331-2966(-)